MSKSCDVLLVWYCVIWVWCRHDVSDEEIIWCDVNVMWYKMSWRDMDVIWCDVGDMDVMWCDMKVMCHYMCVIWAWYGCDGKGITSVAGYLYFFSTPRPSTHDSQKKASSVENIHFPLHCNYFFPMPKLMSCLRLLCKRSPVPRCYSSEACPGRSHCGRYTFWIYGTLSSPWLEGVVCLVL